MKKIKILASLVVVLWLAAGILSVEVFAEDSVGTPNLTSGSKDGTVLPGTIYNVTDCKDIMNYVSSNSDKVRELFVKSDSKSYITLPLSNNNTSASLLDILACGIKTGDIHLWMIPYYIRYVLEFIIGIAGLIAVGSIVYGGYLYLFAGLSQDKDTGKKAILYGVVGMILTLVAWAFVNIIISFVTG